MAKGLTNYWGYNTIGFFAPHDGYSAAVRAGAPGGQVAEFKAMVDSLHAAGLEVLLDVVFNHTAEGDHIGPDAVPPRAGQPGVLPARPGRSRPLRRHHRLRQRRSTPATRVSLQLIMDSLRYWLDRDARRRLPLRPRPDPRPPGRRLRRGVGLLRPRVAGSRRLAGQAHRRALGRRPGRQLRHRPLPAAVERVERPLPGHDARLLAPPRRPARRVRDARFSGSSDLYGGSRRRPTASVNLITVHDGFTLRDLVSYDTKHNEANGEDNRDGTDDNRSWNCGVEGPTRRPGGDRPARRRVAGAARPRCCCRSACRCSSAATSSVARRAATTTPTARTTRSPGSTGRTSTRTSSPSPVASIALRHAHPAFRRRRFLTGAEA